MRPARNAGDWARQWPQDLSGYRREYFSSTDQLVTLRMFSGPNRDNWAVARKRAARTTEFKVTDGTAARPISSG